MSINIKSIFEGDDLPREQKQYEGPDFQAAIYEGLTKLDGFRFNVAKHETAQSLEELTGVKSTELTEHKTWTEQIDTELQTLDVQILNVDSTRSKLWNGGKLLHECDGFKFLSDPPGREGMIGQPCGCPTDPKERKKAAADKWGPKPAIEIEFLLMDDPELGKGKITSGNWDLKGELDGYVGRQLAAAEESDPAGEIFAELVIKNVTYDITKGPRKGSTVDYNYVSLRDVKPLSQAVAE